MKQLTAVILASFILFLSACKKEDSVPTKTDMISRAWKYTAFTAVSGALTVDVLLQMEACEKDNLLRFKSDKTFTDEEGATKCNATDPQIINTGNWAFNANETKLVLDGDSVLIVSLSSTKLHLRYTDNGPPTATVDLIFAPAQ